MHNANVHDVPRPQWLAQVQEPVLDPDQVIIDPHHHLWDREGNRYLLDEFLHDLRDGHRVVATVYSQCRSMYRSDGNPAFAPVGETEFANRLAERCADGGHGGIRVCAGIVGHADLCLGSAVQDVLQAHVEAAGLRFKGIRHIATWDADDSVMNPALRPPPGLLLDARFRQGFEALGRMGLSFDAWVFHPQLQDVAALAAAFQDTRIVLNHLGGVLNIGAYADRREEVRQAWLKSMRALASHPNVYVKLGGLGMRIAGFDYKRRPLPPTSETLASDFAPYVLPVVDLFGPERCMFESNFPVDKGSFSYRVLWNAFKRLALQYSQQERDRLFHGTAAQCYRLEERSVP